VWQNFLEEGSQVRTASDDDASAYLRHRPSEGGAYTIRNIAAVRDIEKHVYAQAGDDDVAKARSVQRFPRLSEDDQTVSPVRRWLRFRFCEQNAGAASKQRLRWNVSGGPSKRHTSVVAYNEAVSK